ncbi:EF-hand domain-containing protein 1 [Orchesella cincta]|uniref:EF-hand domain-containing protein 1 n=1 Tax=Orchesella cincta TaxID=48709 RepID=A0A1D2NMB3_ORCCI|nr:EF-hand domain-containing protein 1 [Orchesella cincta]
MEQCKRIDGLPFLPGNTFRDPCATDFRRSQTFNQKNGFVLPKIDYLGVGEVPIPAKTMSVKDLFDMYNYDPSLTYGEPRPRAPPPLVPAFVALEKKTLKFNAYYKESIPDSQDENYRVRLVDIYYFLEDDTIMVNEPRIENSGIPQGKFLRRHRIPKNDIGETYHWKDLNVACEVMFYGRVFRIVDADNWTKQFYESEGLLLNDTEILPKDPFIDKRFNAMQKRTFHTPDVLCDSRKKYMEYGGKVLRFHCVWDEREVLYGSLRKFDLLYHLQDDMVEVVELQEPNCGRDPFRLLLHKTRLPKNWKDLPLSFPIISMEVTRHEIVEYYEPKDFKIGETINIFGRRFLIFDMDAFTRQFYRDHFGFTDFTPICIDPKQPRRPDPGNPPWNGWGSPEDSLMNCLSIVPQRPRFDQKKTLVFGLTVLKFAAVMDSTRPEDIGREFIISFRLVDDKMAVYEKPVRNSGWPGGKFLDYTLIPKAGSSKDNPEYYGLNDLYIGSMLDIFGHRFCLNAADRMVLDFINTNPSCFSEHIRNNIKEYFDCKDAQDDTQKKEKPCDPGSEVCEKPIGEGFFEILGLGVKRRDVHPCADNPNPEPMPYDWDRCRSLGYNCGVQRPELTDDDLECIDQVCEKPCPGNPDMFETKELAVCQPERYLAPEPLTPNPVEDDNSPCIPYEKYHQKKAVRFDCYNPPDADRQYETFMKQAKFNCPCPPKDLEPPST